MFSFARSSGDNFNNPFFSVLLSADVFSLTVGKLSLAKGTRARAKSLQFRWFGVQYIWLQLNDIFLCSQLKWQFLKIIAPILECKRRKIMKTNRSVLWLFKDFYHIYIIYFLLREKVLNWVQRSEVFLVCLMLGHIINCVMISVPYHSARWCCRKEPGFDPCYGLVFQQMLNNVHALYRK